MKNQKQSARWIKITVFLTLDNHAGLVRGLVPRFESEFSVKHLYYARYTTLETSTFEVSALTAADWNDIKRFFKRTGGVIKVKVEDRGSGSIAHAYMYQAVKNLPVFEKDLAEDDAFLDLIHWASNQRGMDYVREARAYTYASLRILHKTALESSQNIASMRQFNASVKTHDVAASLVERLNLLGAKAGKAQKKVKVASDDPGPPPKRSGRVASRKAPGSKHSKSSGSARRLR